jgi:hypothetical protein
MRGPGLAINLASADIDPLQTLLDKKRRRTGGNVRRRGSAGKIGRNNFHQRPIDVWGWEGALEKPDEGRVRTPLK